MSIKKTTYQIFLKNNNQKIKFTFPNGKEVVSVGTYKTNESMPATLSKICDMINLMSDDDKKNLLLLTLKMLENDD